MKAYRLITGRNDAEFCRRNARLLNDGWEISRSAVMCFDRGRGKRVCGRAIVKQTYRLEYSSDTNPDEI